MSIFDKVFGKNKPDKEGFNEVFDQMTGVIGKAKTRDGYPVCPNCSQQFPVSVERMKEEGGVPTFMCPGCGKTFRV